MDANFTLGVMGVVLPTVTVLVGILLNNARLTDLRSHLDVRFQEIDRRFQEVDRRFQEVDRRLGRIEAAMDVLTGKVIEIGNPLTRVEERLKLS